MQQVTPEDRNGHKNALPQEKPTSNPHFIIDSAEDAADPDNKSPIFYTQEQDEDLDFHLPLDDFEELQIGQSSPFVSPFQNSATLQTIPHANAATHQSLRQAADVSSPPPPSSKKTGIHLSSVWKYLLIGCVVLITVVGSSLFVFAQPTTSPNPNPKKGAQTKATNTAPLPGSSRRAQGNAGDNNPPANQDNQNQQQGADALPPNQVPSTQQLTQLRWAQAGLSLGDAIEAQRTGTTFTDTEMSYDYRDIGSRTNHGGTLISSTFLLTPGGQVRFTHNDVRAINNNLYDAIHNGKRIQQFVNATSSLTSFQVVQIQGRSHKYAWVTISFQLFQSKIDPASGKRTEGLDLDPATGQPRVHHMIVGLLRVGPQNQGSDAPVGGTGWLVNIYELDGTVLPAIATSPTL